MKIATWNVERLKHRHSLDEIISVCNNVQADILILTETDLQITPDFQYCFHTPLLAEVDAAFYKATENKVSIFTNYPCVQQHTAYDKYTSLCGVRNRNGKPSCVRNHYRNLWKPTSEFYGRFE